MRICFVSHGSGRGGAEEVLLESLECLKELGFDCRVLMPGDLGLGENLRELGIAYRSLPYWGWMGHKSFWSRLEAAARNIALTAPAAWELRKWNPDIIYSNTMTVCFGALLAHVLRRPHVWHLHELGYEDHGLTFDFGRTFSYRLINSASACIAVSQITADKFAEHIDRDKLTVMFQSVHRRSLWRPAHKLAAALNQAVPPPSRKTRCIIVGRLSEGKRQEDAVAAMAELKEQGTDSELLIIGHSNPGYAEKLRRQVREHQLEDRVSILGSVFDRLPFVESSDIVLMCSRCEAFGRVTVEGMLAGKPVIAADTGANPELIRPGSTGLLYRFGDVKDLARKIRQLCENPDLARRIGENARGWAEPIFRKERYGTDLASFLMSVLNRDRRRFLQTSVVAGF